MKAHEVWTAIVDRAKRNLKLCSGVRLHLVPIKPVAIKGDVLIVEVPAELHPWVERHWRGWLEEAVRAVSDLKGIVLRKESP